MKCDIHVQEGEENDETYIESVFLRTNLFAESDSGKDNLILEAQVVDID
jgi:hypothetical protein